MLRDRMAEPTPTLEHRLQAYTALLTEWTRRINLISANDIPHIRTRHIDDCLRLVPLIPPGTARGIDLGSGAGLPGLVLAIATGIPFDLIEADRRKAAFLMEAARVTAAPVTVHARRVEDCRIPPAPLITARALAPLPALLELAGPLLAPGGTMLAPKGARAAEEMAAAQPHPFRIDSTGPAASPILVIRREPAYV